MDPGAMTDRAFKVMLSATNGNAAVAADPVYRQCIAAAFRSGINTVLPPTPNVSTQEEALQFDVEDAIRAHFLDLAQEIDPSPYQNEI